MGCMVELHCDALETPSRILTVTRIQLANRSQSNFQQLGTRRRLLQNFAYGPRCVHILDSQMAKMLKVVS